jgi:putative transposase
MPTAALMTNHVHLLVTPSEAGAIGMMMQDLGRRYVRVINTIHARSGTLWEARFRSGMIDSENYLLTCQRYIELNPVRAGLVSQPGAYPWSSHSYYAAEIANQLITEHPVYLRLGSTAPERSAAYLTCLQVRWMSALWPAFVTRSIPIPRSARKRSSTMREAKLGRSVRLPARGRPVKSVTGKLL